MTLDARSKYPTERTYVVKVRRDAKADALAGLLENIVTGRQGEFANASELLDALKHDIEAQAGACATSRLQFAAQYDGIACREP
ncbi:MAG: hypothetical protein ACXWCY_16310 [Burkholderiales bacterium]